jgi:diguanylate cyclase
MINQILSLERLGISPFLVKFRNASLEQEFNTFNLPVLRQQAKVGAVIAILSWILVAFMEPMNVPSSALLSILLAAFISIAALAGVYWSTFSKFFERNHQLIVMSGVIVTMLAVSIKIKFYPDFSLTHYFPALIIITIWMFSISGLSFTKAILCGQAFYLFVVFTFLMDSKTSNVELITAIYYMLISYSLGAAVSYYNDVQARRIFLAHKALEQEKQHHHHKSLHDMLTKLPNRELLEDRLHQAISFASRKHTKCAGMYIDLDKFKSINDQYGHSLGDLYLKEVVSRLQDITRGTDTLARIGGDEFFLLMSDIKDEEAALVLSQKIQDNLNEYFILADKIKLKGLGASVGVCMFPYQSCTPNDIINRADKAMYHVKQLGNTRLFA